MTAGQAIILGLVQGLAEFLPISSSGHLAILQHFFGINPDQVLFFAVMLHVGTLVSVFIVYWADIWGMIREFCLTWVDVAHGKGMRINHNDDRKMCWLVIVATIPTAIMGLLFNDFFESLYSSLISIGIALLITGIILFIAERYGNGNKEIKRTTFTNAFIVGICQGIAIAPGISRSGCTLVGSLLSGLDRKFAAKFVFLVSIPSILGSVVLELPDALAEGIPGNQMLIILLGVLVSAVSGLFAIKAMIRLISNKRLIIFSIYTWIVGAGVIIYTLLS